MCEICSNNSNKNIGTSRFGIFYVNFGTYFTTFLGPDFTFEIRKKKESFEKKKILSILEKNCWEIEIVLFPQ